MIASLILTIGIVSYLEIYKGLSLSVQGSKGKSLAVNLAQEKIETMKNFSYHRLLVTTATVADSNFNPSIVYDLGYYPAESVVAGGITFERRVYVRKKAESGADLIYKSWQDPDTGLKEILVYVVWRENNDWKKVELRNLRSDPGRLGVEATFSGTVISGVTPLQGALVDIVENTVWSDWTDASGNYSFSVKAGTYTVRAGLPGHLSGYSGRSIIGGEVLDVDFNLTQMASGTIGGAVYLRDHLLISQVVGSTLSPSGFYQEYVEVYNPSSWTWTMATDSNAGVISIAYKMRNQDYQIIQMAYNTLTLGASQYYLFANTTPVTAAGVVRVADAVYNDNNSDYPNIIRINTDSGNDAAGVAVGYVASSSPIDILGWKTGGQNPEWYEGSPLEQVIGLEADEQYIRKSSTNGITAGVGRAWDSGVNTVDFLRYSPLSFPPRNSADVEAPISGTPAQGAIVFANDNLAPSVTANSSGVFSLVSVATGTWTLTVSSGTSYTEVTNIAVAVNDFDWVGSLGFSSTSGNGYVSGRVTTSGGAAISGIQVSAPGATPQSADSQGNYRLSVPTGAAVEVVANANNQNSTYLSASSNTSINSGQITQSVNFALSQGGGLRGYMSTNGVDPLPGIAVSAQLDGVEKGATTSGDDGRYNLTNLTTGLYLIVAYPDGTSVVTPSTGIERTVLSAQTVSAGTFTVANAQAEFSGSLTNSGSIIKTGVLVIASTEAVAGDPPTFNSSLLSGGAVYYGASSGSDGTYRIYVTSGGSYNIYAWYTTWPSGVTTPSIVKKSSASVSVSAGGSKSVSFVWP